MLADLGPYVAPAIMCGGLSPSWLEWARAMVQAGITVPSAALLGLLGWGARVLWDRREEEKEKKKTEREEEGAGGELPLTEVREHPA